MTTWTCALELDEKREVAAGSEAALVDAIRNGADLRVNTAFRHNEHVDTNSDNPELVREVMDFRVTYLLDDRWVAAIENLRMPVDIPEGFADRPSMSFFMYNQNGLQAIARPYLDGKSPDGEPGPTPLEQWADMPKMKVFDRWDGKTNAPSNNFAYDFEKYRFLVQDHWQEMLHHDADGKVLSGSVESLEDAVLEGREAKVGIQGLCSDLAADPSQAMDHTVFVHIGATYDYSERKLLMGAANPLIRVAPAIPIRYESRNWDFGWLLPRTDGHLARWLCNPYTMKFEQTASRHAMRWFVQK